MVDDIIVRLKTAPVLKLVAGAADFSVAAESRPKALPAAYVLPLSERALGDDGISEGVTQLVEARFGIALALSNVADPKGGAALTDLDAIRQAVRAALLGWAPDGYEDGLSYAGGALLGFAGNVLWWQDAYSLIYLMDVPD